MVPNNRLCVPLSARSLLPKNFTWNPTFSHAKMHVYEVRLRKDKGGVYLISDALPFGRLWYTQVSHAIGYAEFRRRPLCDFQKKLVDQVALG
jgi:hypothetical protein